MGLNGQGPAIPRGEDYGRVVRQRCDKGHVTRVRGASGGSLLQFLRESTIYVNYHVFPYFSHVLYSLSVSTVAIYSQVFVIYILAIHVLATHCSLCFVPQGSRASAVSPREARKEASVRSPWKNW